MYVPIKFRSLFPTMIRVDTLTIQTEVESSLRKLICFMSVQHGIDGVEKRPQTQGHKRLENFFHVYFKVNACKIVSK